MTPYDLGFDKAAFDKYQVDYYNDIDDVVLSKNHRDFVKLIREAIKNETDYVEVVWCRDCKHRYVPYDCALWYGTNNGNEYFIERGDDFFCSYAEKKEGVEE